MLAQRMTSPTATAAYPCDSTRSRNADNSAARVLSVRRSTFRFAAANFSLLSLYGIEPGYSIEQYGPDIQNFDGTLRYLGFMSTHSKPHRALACLFALCAVATLVLLAFHPGGGGRTITEVIQAEARDQVKDGVVHGGFIFISAALIACFAGLSRILHPARVAVTAGFVTFCVGAGALMMSMGLDGLVVPAIAARCLREGTAQSLASAQTLLLFCGACIKILMPTGLLFEGGAMLSYSVAMIARRWFWVGGLGVAAGIAMLIGPLLLPGLGAHALIAGIVILCMWYLGLAMALGLEKSGAVT